MLTCYPLVFALPIVYKNITLLTWWTIFQACDSETKGSNLPSPPQPPDPQPDRPTVASPHPLSVSTHLLAYLPAWRLAQVEEGFLLLHSFSLPAERDICDCCRRGRGRERASGGERSDAWMDGWTARRRFSCTNSPLIFWWMVREEIPGQGRCDMKVEMSVSRLLFLH